MGKKEEWRKEHEQNGKEFFIENMTKLIYQRKARRKK